MSKSISESLVKHWTKKGCLNAMYRWAETGDDVENLCELHQPGLLMVLTWEKYTITAISCAQCLFWCQKFLSDVPKKLKNNHFSANSDLVG